MRHFGWFSNNVDSVWNQFEPFVCKINWLTDLLCYSNVNLVLPTFRNAFFQRMSKIRSVPNRVARPFLITLYRILITGVDKFQDWRGLLMNVELSLHDPFRNFYEAIRADNRTPKNCLLTHFPCLAWTPVRQKLQTPISWIRELKIFELFLKRFMNFPLHPCAPYA